MPKGVERIAFLDVDYREPGAVAACVLASGWSDAAPSAELVERVAEVEPYQPGQFYRRELPCLLAVLDRLPAPPDVVVVDGYVWLGEGRPGLGARLHEALGRAVPVVGVAKTCFQGAAGIAAKVFRGGSRQPLWVTTAGIDPEEAAEQVCAMHGTFRIPTLIKRVDQLCRNA